MTLNSIPNCSEEQYLIILKSKYGNTHKNERAFYYGLWCIKDTMREVSEGPFQAILPYTEYPLNKLIKNIELHHGDESYFETACKELEKIYSNLLIANICCIEQFGTKKQKRLLKKIILCN